MKHVSINFRGHLRVENLSQKLSAAKAEMMGNEKVSVVVDVLEMTGYDREARAMFTEWNTQNRDAIDRVAVITDKTMWRVVISGIAFATGQEMKAFESESGALAWLES